MVDCLTVCGTVFERVCESGWLAGEFACEHSMSGPQAELEVWRVCSLAKLSWKLEGLLFGQAELEVWRVCSLTKLSWKCGGFAL